MIHNLTEQLPDVYNGLALYVPSITRYDKVSGKIMSGPARSFCNSVISRYGFNIENCIIRLAIDRRDRPGDTKRVILMGEDSLRIRTGREGIDAHAGYVEKQGEIEYTFTYPAQDCVDLYNQETDEEEDDEDNAGNNAKDSAPTSRSNFPFWFEADVGKLLSGRWKKYSTQQMVAAHVVGTAQAIKLLQSRIDSYLFLDIETHPATNTLQCFSFAWPDGPVYTISVYDYKANQGCNVPVVMCALARAMQKNTTVIHNSMFDLLFMAAYHGVPYSRRVWDTMLTHHRAFLEVEKSLAHCIRYYLNERYHKGEAGTYHPRNHWQHDKLLLYNAKDVATLRGIWAAQCDLLREQPRLERSFTQANNLVYPYCNLSLQGILTDVATTREIEKKNTKLIAFYLRVITLLVGHQINPGSPMQLSSYFFTELGYAPKKYTDKGAPSLESDALYAMFIETQNPVITVLLQYRKLVKQNGMLNFKYFGIKKGRK